VPYAEATQVVEQPIVAQAEPQIAAPPVGGDLSSPTVEAVPVPAQPAMAQPSAMLMDGAVAAADAASQEVSGQQIEGVLPLDYASQAWALISDMADDVAFSHEPLSSVAPIAGASQSSFLSRLLGGLGLGLRRGEPAAAAELSTGGVWRIAPLWRNIRGRAAQAEYVENVESGYAGGRALSSGSASTSRPVGGTLSSNIVAGQGPLTGHIAQQLGTTYPNALPLPYAAAGANAVAGSTSGTAQYAGSSSAFEAGTSGGLSSVYQPTALRSAMIMMPADQMSQSLGEFLMADGGGQPVPAADGGDEASNYAQLLRQLYGQPQLDSQMPLAIPYGAFALPASSSSSYVSALSLSALEGQGYQVNYGGGAQPGGPSHLSMPIPSIPRFQQSEPVEYVTPFYKGDSEPVAEVISHSWGTASESSDSDSGEAAAWANVVSSAVSGASSASGAPALSLAGQERSFVDPNEAHHDPHGHKSDDPQELDDLADTVYTLIRRRLAIERERSF
jgi:hypothetical protein